MQPNALIASLADPGIRALAALGRVRSYPKQALIIHEGDVADTVFIVLAGRVRVFSSADDGRDVILDVLGSGEIVGEMALDGSPRSASIMTMEATTVAVIDAATLRERLKSDLELAMLLVTELLGRLRKTSRVVKQLALGDVYERLSVVLNEELLRSPTGHSIDGLTQQDLADRIGASRDMVNRIFGELERGGYVQVARRRISVLKALPARW
jgi:CRP/FNR family transcriptional regulator, cyclic AMP receptor protein